MSDDSHLFDLDGNRLYLTQEERRAFVAAAKMAPREERTFATLLHDTGCRVSEGLAVTGRRIDLPGQRVVFETLKKRRKGVFRAVPLSTSSLDTLDMVHGLTEAGQRKDRTILDQPLWSFSRTTAWRIITRLMEEAEIGPGPHRTPKGLRHGFGMAAILSGVPVTTLRVWMGHATLNTTSIYLQAVAAEDREIAARMWS